MGCVPPKSTGRSPAPRARSWEAGPWGGDEGLTRWGGGVAALRRGTDLNSFTLWVRPAGRQPSTRQKQCPHQIRICGALTLDFWSPGCEQQMFAVSAQSEVPSGARADRPGCLGSDPNLTPGMLARKKVSVLARHPLGRPRRQESRGGSISEKMQMECLVAGHTHFTCTLTRVNRDRRGKLRPRDGEQLAHRHTAGGQQSQAVGSSHICLPAAQGAQAGEGGTGRGRRYLHHPLL